MEDDENTHQKHRSKNKVVQNLKDWNQHIDGLFLFSFYIIA